MKHLLGTVSLICAAGMGALWLFGVSYVEGQQGSPANPQDESSVYTYRFRSVGKVEDRLEELEKIANEMSGEGWELMGTDSIARPDGYVSTLLSFRRRAE